MNYEKLEKDFISQSPGVRGDVLSLINDIHYSCKECWNSQPKNYHDCGPEPGKRYAWELPRSGKVTDMVPKLLSANINGELRRVVEEYADHHIVFNCKEGFPLIQELRNKLTEVRNTKTIIPVGVV